MTATLLPARSKPRVPSPLRKLLWVKLHHATLQAAVRGDSCQLFGHSLQSSRVLSRSSSSRSRAAAAAWYSSWYCRSRRRPSLQGHASAKVILPHVQRGDGRAVLQRPRQRHHPAQCEAAPRDEEACESRVGSLGKCFREVESCLVSETVRAQLQQVVVVVE